MPAFNTPAPQPEVRLHPATPSTGGGAPPSKFTRVARSSSAAQPAIARGTNGAAETGSLARQSGQNYRRASVKTVDPDPNPFGDLSYVDAPAAPHGVPVRNATPLKSSLKDSNRSRVYLPDVTGLTAAVESPAKPGVAYYSYKAESKARESEARLLQTLQAVQNQLQDLEDENGISRRRVRELEMELEECKREVARERTRLLERELDSSFRHGKGTKGKGKARAGTGVGAGLGVIDDERLHERYKDVVEEKRALEALINSLRTHLTRLTAELSSHQELLTELRRLRDTDAKALAEKGAEIIRLSEEVQRLAGEVEVLRGVVEEGLKERRASREGEMVGNMTSAADSAMSVDLEGEDTEREEQDEEEDEEDQPHGDEDAEEEEDEDDVETVDDHEEEERGPAGGQRQRDPWGVNPDMSMNNFAPTHATFGSNDVPSAPAPVPKQRMVDDAEMSRIVAEVEERRSNRSIGSIRGISASPPPQHQRQRKIRSISTRVQVGNDTVAHDMDSEDDDEVEAQQDDEHDDNPLFDPSAQRGFISSSPNGFTTNLNLNSRPSAPTPRHAAHHQNPFTHTRQRSTGTTSNNRQNNNNNADNVDTDADADAHVAPDDSPFPQIRGERLERLFFSAPEHNAQTCTVCYRRRQNPSSSADHLTPGMAGPTNGANRPRSAQNGASSPTQEPPMRIYLTYSSDPSYYHRIGKQYGLPAQTVVARVVRELEDDFTHYKSIYVELADQYKIMDAASDVLRRNTLAKHLKEVVDVLEQKGDQIASLYDLLSFKDRQTFGVDP
ncbi:hypothetical protein CVT24_009101 [Panaeolus cyanescens]|uniref:Cep57 centrosome microtubule-binding domain-containing protein n=1 Tax=Panaeolus cyanescens TaxID=181874 RepID=A0A409W3Q0_9AGAR|nr:hypothetical protein CVT24_009101 [Panaeolus cyanescens]